MIKTCICGKQYEVLHHAGNRKYCSDECCAEFKRMRRRGERRTKKRIIEKHMGNTNSLDEVAVLATKAGMSYGNYVAKYNL